MNLSSKKPSEWKDLGNESFKNKNYDQAIEYYSNAMKLDDSQSVFFTNRSRCFKLKGQYQKAFEDANNGIELDVQNIKAHLLCGQLLAKMGQTGIKDIQAIELSITRLTKALTLCAGQDKQTFEKDLQKYIKRSKKLLWYKNREIKNSRLTVIQKQLFDLIDKKGDYNREQKEAQKQLLKDTMGDPNQVLIQDIPEYYCCQISMDFMEDPITTPQGITYDRLHLFQHFQTNGLTDPVTRKTLRREQCVQNINLKQAIEDYLEKNPWAYEHHLGETYQDIEF